MLEFKQLGNKNKKWQHIHQVPNLKLLNVTTMEILILN